MGMQKKGPICGKAADQGTSWFPFCNSRCRTRDLPTGPPACIRFQTRQRSRRASKAPVPVDRRGDESRRKCDAATVPKPPKPCAEIFMIVRYCTISARTLIAEFEGTQGQLPTAHSSPQ